MSCCIFMSRIQRGPMTFYYLDLIFKFTVNICVMGLYKGVKTTYISSNVILNLLIHIFNKRMTTIQQYAYNTNY